MKILIKAGTLITAADSFSADILIEDDKIAAIGADLRVEDAEIVDAAGKLVLPVESIRIPTSTCLCSERSLQTIITPGIKRLLLAAQRPYSILCLWTGRR